MVCVTLPISVDKKFWFWCKNKVKENTAYIFLTESYLMLQVQTIDGRILSDFG